MSGIADFFTGSKPKTVKPPKKDDSEVQKAVAEARAKRRRSKGFEGNFLSGFENNRQSLKTNFGGS